MHEEQDVQKMGGLKKYMPITHATFVMGWLAIIGTPFFSGFFSKDEILYYAWQSPRGHFFLWLLGVTTAGVTAFYMTRLMSLTFWGKSRVSPDVHPHESGLPMTIPLMVLGVLSVVGGYLGIPHVLGHGLHLPNLLEEWLSPVVMEIPGFVGASAPEEFMLMGISVAVAGVSAFLSYHLYVNDPAKPKEIANKLSHVHTWILNKFYVDEFYFSKIINPLIEASKGLWVYIDVNFIDKATYAVSDLSKEAGDGARSLQNGNMQQYAMYIVLGVAGAMIWILIG
jgi:NADH-quinone oxidoreductase subunit L